MAGGIVSKGNLEHLTGISYYACSSAFIVYCESYWMYAILAC